LIEVLVSSTLHSFRRTATIGQPSSVSRARSASSLAVIGSTGAVILLDASPDIRLQSRALLGSSLYPKDRDSFLDGVFITHAHIGHYAGLLHFGKEASAEHRLPLFGTDRFLSFMAANEPWAELLRGGHLDPIGIDGVDAVIDGDVKVSAIAVPHRDEHSDTVAFSVSVQGQPWLLYLPDIDDWPSWDSAEEEIARHDVALLDATFSSTAELPSRDILAIRHPLVPDTIDRLGHLTSQTRIVLTHINPSNPLGDPEASTTMDAESAGFFIAYDGFTLSTGG
jgi:pyrroloquinoline quinone biosynthesis protein B